MWRRIIYFLSIFLIIDGMLTSCGTLRKVPVETVTRIEYRDSLIYHTDTVKVDVPYERVVEVVPMLDTLYLETNVAKAEAYLDTTLNALKGKIENKPVRLEKEIHYVDRIQYRDSVVTKEVPVEVEKIVKKTPKWAWYSLLGITIETLILAAFIYFLFFKKLW